MAMDNLISIEFTDAELTQIDQHLDALELIFKNKVVQLTAKESQRYGKLGNETETWSNTVFTDSEAKPELVPNFINKAEWAKDEKARDQLSPRATRLESLAKQVNDTNRLIGFDIYNTCLSVYNNTKYLSTQNVPGTKAYYDKWSIQFPGRGGASDKTDTPK